MQGVLTIIPTSGAVSSKELAAPPTLQDLVTGIGGGYIEIVPGFTRYEGKRCVAFCDEDGKRKQQPFNFLATSLWENACGVVSLFQRQKIPEPWIRPGDLCCGRRAVIRHVESAAEIKRRVRHLAKRLVRPLDPNGRMWRPQVEDHAREVFACPRQETGLIAADRSDRAVDDLDARLAQHHPRPFQKLDEPPWRNVLLADQ